MATKLTAGAFVLLILLATANYLFNGTGLPDEARQLMTIIMDTASMGIGVFLPMLIIFVLLAPIAYFISHIGSK